MDDKKEMQDTDAAFDILGFTQEEKLDLFKGTGSICYLGNTAFGQRGKKNHRKMPALTRPRRMKLTKSKHENDPDDTRMMGRCEKQCLERFLKKNDSCCYLGSAASEGNSPNSTDEKKMNGIQTRILEGTSLNTQYGDLVALRR